MYATIFISPWKHLAKPVVSNSNKSATPVRRLAVLLLQNKKVTGTMFTLWLQGFYPGALASTHSLKAGGDEMFSKCECGWLFSPLMHWQLVQAVTSPSSCEGWRQWKLPLYRFTLKQLEKSNFYFSSFFLNSFIWNKAQIHVLAKEMGQWQQFPNVRIRKKKKKKKASWCIMEKMFRLLICPNITTCNFQLDELVTWTCTSCTWMNKMAFKLNCSFPWHICRYHLLRAVIRCFLYWWIVAILSFCDIPQLTSNLSDDNLSVAWSHTWCRSLSAP